MLKQFRNILAKYCHRQALSASGSASSEIWFRRAAELGHLKSQYDMDTKSGMDLSTPWESLLKIADKGHPDALNLCAIALIIGDLKTRPCAIAGVDLLRPSITGSHGPRLAKLQAEGPRIALPKPGAISRFHRRDIYFCDMLASGRIAKMPLERDYERAYRYLTKAKETGCPVATNNLAVCLELGLGTSVDTSTARRLYLEAAASELVARFNAGRCHETGIGGAVDIDKAALTYSSAPDLSAAKLGLLRIRKSRTAGGEHQPGQVEPSEIESILMRGPDPLRQVLTLALESITTRPDYRLTSILILCGGDLATAEREFNASLSPASPTEKQAAIESAEYFLGNARLQHDHDLSRKLSPDVADIFGHSPIGKDGATLNPHSLTSPRGLVITAWGEGFSADKLLDEAQMNLKSFGEEVSIQSLGLAWDELGKGGRWTSDAWMKSINHKWRNRIGFNSARAIAETAMQNHDRRRSPNPDIESQVRLAQSLGLSSSEFKSLLNAYETKQQAPDLLAPSETLLAKLLHAPLDAARLFILFCLLRSVDDVTTHYSGGGGGDEPVGHDSAYYAKRRAIAETPNTPQELVDGSIRAHIMSSPVPAIRENVSEIMTLLAQGYHYERRLVRVG
jgi:TPR repeat protein